MSNSTPKKRKSNTNIDAIAGGVQRGPKMERYKLDELEKQMEGESSQQQAVNRRGSIIGAVGSLLKKIKSTSTLKNPESARHSFASTGSSSVFAFPDPDALDKDDGGSEFSFESGSSTGSIDPELLERCEKNKLLRRVLNGEERAMSSVYSQPGTQVSASLESTGSSTASDSVSGVSLESYSSITTGSAVGLEMEEKEEWEPGKMLPPPLPRSTPGTPHRISMAAFCTPKRPSSRYSMKSAPGAILDGQGNGTGQNESDSGSLVDNGTSLIRGLCNSVRRTHSSMSDIRLHRKPSSARRRKHLVSMADLPEEEQENHDSDKKKSTEVPKMPGGVTTPISPLGRRQSIWSKLGSGSGKRRNSLDAVSPMLMEQVSFSTSTSVALDQEKITPSSALSAARGIGSSGRKKSSSSFSRFLQGFRKGSTSTTNSASASMSSRDKTPTSTGDTIVLKRRPTMDQKYGVERRMSKYRIPNNEQAPSSSSYMEPSYHNRSLFHKSSSASMQEKRAKAKVFLSVFTVADKPILELLSDQSELDKFDAIAVDVTVEGYPVSSTAKAIVSEGEVRDQLHKLAMTHPNKNGFYVRVGGPDLLYVMAHNTGSGEGDAVRCMRVGVFAALKELFSTNHTRRKLLLYPLFCSTPSDMDEQLLRHFIQTCNLVIREVDIGSKGYSVVLTGLDKANTDAFQQMFLAMSKEMKELLDEDEGQHDESMTGRSTASSASDMTDPFSMTAEATDL